MQTIRQRRILESVRTLAGVRADDSGKSTAAALAYSIVQGIDTGTSAITNPVNWPNSATFGVSYTCHDRQFPQVDHGETIVYFDHVSQLIQWLEEKRDWIRGTDYDFSMHYSVYTWDWGPVFKYSKSM